LRSGGHIYEDDDGDEDNDDDDDDDDEDEDEDDGDDSQLLLLRLVVYTDGCVALYDSSQGVAFWTGNCEITLLYCR